MRPEVKPGLLRLGPLQSRRRPRRDRNHGAVRISSVGGHRNDPSDLAAVGLRDTGCDFLARLLSNAGPRHRAPIRSSGGHGRHSAACRDGVRRFRICAKPLRRRVCSAVRPGRGWDAGADDHDNGARFVPVPRGRRVAVFPRSASKRNNFSESSPRGLRSLRARSSRLSSLFLAGTAMRDIGLAKMTAVAESAPTTRGPPSRRRTFD